MINILPLLMQATVPSFRLSILNVDGDVVQDDDSELIRLPDLLLWQGQTYTTLTEEAIHGSRHIKVGLASNTSNTIRTFVAFVLVGNYLNHMCAVVHKLGVWFLLDLSTQEVI
jgi:hypothetical protein